MQIADLTGLWRRSLIAWPDGRRDTTTKVQWLQGLGLFGDLRQPAPGADFSHVKSIDDLTLADCRQLAEQQAFAGDLTVVGNFFEWARLIDFQPRAAHPDVGSLRWDDGMLIEEGRDLPYVEHWHRDAEVNSQAAIGGTVLYDASTGINCVLVQVGTLLMLARDRKISLPPRESLRDCITEADSIEHARAMIDCEISLAHATSNGFRIYSSTLPYRVGEILPADAPKNLSVKKREGCVTPFRFWQT
jgi:hypothetical protein